MSEGTALSDYRDSQPPPYQPIRYRRRGASTALIVGVIVLAILFVVLLVALLSQRAPGPIGGGPSPSDGNGTSPGASPTAATTDSPGGEATPEPLTYPEDLIEPGSVASVAVDSLNLREGAPGDPNHDQIVARLAAGGSVYVLDWPLAIDAAAAPNGQRWYSVIVLDEEGYPPTGITAGGWVAGGPPDQPYLARGGFDCGPQEPTVDAGDLASTPAFIRLSCKRGQTLQTTGILLTCQTPGPPTAGLEPAWLVNSQRCAVLVDEAWDPQTQQENVPSVNVVIDPDGGLTLPESGAIVEVTGHFDDAASDSCAASGTDAPPADPDFLVLACREQFVMESINQIGQVPIPGP